jgi:internalin A
MQGSKMMNIFKKKRVLSPVEERIKTARETEAKSLDLSGMDLTELPEEIRLLTNLEALNLFNNKLTSLPDSIRQLNQLQLLFLNDNHLTSLPESIGEFCQLQQLEVNNNELTSLTNSIGQLNHLKILYLGKNQLTSLPDSIGELNQLQKIILNDNKLTYLPDSIGKLNQLQELDLRSNQLTTIPDSIGQLSQLQTLELSQNRLTSLPESIGQLNKLQTLLIAAAPITVKFGPIGKQVGERYIYHHSNELTSLPESIGQLKNLGMLNLAGNQLTFLPETIGQLPNLKSLDLSNNRLSTLPYSLSKLVTLSALYLHENDSLGMPTEVLGRPNLDRESSVFTHFSPTTPASILDYYFRIHAAKRPLNEAKLILVGRGGVGKTSLVNRLLHNRFDPKEKRTEGICISEWKVKLKSAEEARLNIWDFGGQEIMHATHQFFFTQRSLYLLVLEGRQGAEEADAEYWLKLMESFGTESSGEVSPVLVVMNKIKQNPFDLNRRALRQKFPFIRDFIATDCEHPTVGIDELRNAVNQATGQLKHLHDAFPASWFAIKDKLAGMREKLHCSFISFDEYRDLCAQNGEKEAVGQDSLALHLHNLGIALNFKDDPRLRDTHVLNPHWVTNGIYTLLNAPLLLERKGEIRLDEAAGVLDKTEYPRRMHPFLFDLMKKFELCFTFPDDEGRYLIPELLDKQEPEEAGAFLAKECLYFEYRYPVLPEGLLPRFIVRTHSLSRGPQRWRSGVILAFEGNNALVKADMQDKRVSIYVNGNGPGRRRLLAIIRSDLERIHADIRQLKPEAWVPIPGHPGEAVAYEDLLVLEQGGVKVFPKAIQGRLEGMDVQELLNGVDLEGIRHREITEDRAARPMQLFFSYSHKDEELRNELETHLKLLQRTGKIATWHDRKIEPSDDWKRRIDDNLERADIILLLVSSDFIASDYCYELEMKRALERHEAGEARVVPVIVRDVDWKGAKFASLQALPTDGKAVKLWPDRDSAWRSVSEGIARLADDIREARNVIK